MEIINEPIGYHAIIVTELVKPVDDVQPFYVINTVSMKTVGELKVYFYTPSKYSIARSLGYMIKAKPLQSQYNDRLFGRLSFEYSDRMVNKRKFEFVSIQQFLDYVRAHRAFAEIVELKS